MSSFVFLEIEDPEVNSLLLDLKEIVSGSPQSRPIHLTIRGPYDGRVPQHTLEHCREALRYDTIRIAGVGRFSNPNEEVVFYRVDSAHLRDVWWKPNYPIRDHGFGPHISLYRGHDANLADAVSDFLNQEKIVLLCSEFRIVARQPSQLALFDDTIARETGLSRLHLAARAARH